MSLPYAGFEDSYDPDQKMLFIAIEGVQENGHDLLIKRIIYLLEETWKSERPDIRRISLQMDIKSVEDLWQKFGARINRGTSVYEKSEIVLKLQELLANENVIFLFSDLVTDNCSEERKEIVKQILKSFWEELSALELDQQSSKQLIILAINKVPPRKELFLDLATIVTNSIGMIAVPTLKDATTKDLINWRKQFFKNHENYMDKEAISWEKVMDQIDIPYINNVVLSLGKLLQLSDTEINQTINL